MSIHTERLQARLARTIDRVRAECAAAGELPVIGLDLIPQLALPWYEIRAQQGDGSGGGNTADRSTTDVFLFDEIGGSFGVSAKRFVADLEAITTPRINLRINSPGGSVFEAITIHSALLHHPAKVRAYIDGVAASAASVIAMGADEYDPDEDTGGVFMMPGSQLMLHDASAMEDGNAADHGHMQTWLDRQSQNVAAMYARRGGGTPEEWRAVMLDETWLFADEAVAAGLADAEYSRSPVDGPAPDDRLTRSHDLTVWGYRYAGRAAASAPRPHRCMLRNALSAPVQHENARGVPAQHSNGSEGLSGNDGLTAVERNSGRVRAMTLTRLRTDPDAMRRDAAVARRERGQRLAPGNRRRGQRHPGTAPSGPARSLGFPAELSCQLETRRGQELYHLVGQASVFDRRYEMWDDYGPYWEKVNSRAADVTLAANPDVAFLINHRGVTMARTTNGTLELAASNGLDTDAWLNPKRGDVNDLVVAIEDRNITEMSFAFMLDEGQWNEDFTEFEITRFDLNRGDVSAVNYGANPYTSISARQAEVLNDMDRMAPGMARAALSRLMRRSDLDLDDLYAGYVADVASVEALERRVAEHEPVTATANIPVGRSVAHVEALLIDD